ncbi:threonine-trna ligase [Holotrichia oblita]|uniref:Threonine-trna ligase n=1 Tax=Holotrichia oblita TaxID=644536 RepID=A0ACB9T4A1_HOLOL|nr:threonine-trna ligase [Holotrichia oblita]
MNDNLSILRHSASHIMAQAVKRLFPSAKLAIGPAIDTGFYYDFDIDTPFRQEDLDAITGEIKKIIKERYKIERFTLSRMEAIDFMEKRGEVYKLELIHDLPEGAEISFYKQGEFVDLCAGPHMEHTGQLKAFSLLSVAGAYWRGDSSRKMLQRIYGTAFESKEALQEYLTRLEEAKKRDHRRIGRELDLFDIYDEGPGFPFFLPKGMVLRNILERYWEDMHISAGYQEIKSPLILNEQLWRISGHWEHYQNNMYFTKIDDNDFAVKPMNCPGSMLVYKRRLHSYRDLPIRMAERGVVHRHELSGALHGLMRVRCFTQDDAHIFMTPEMIEDEILGIIQLINDVYSTFGFKYKIELSTRPSNFLGKVEDWDKAEAALASALKRYGKEYTINPGDGAFYGPKIDFHLEDCIGRTWQCGTIQLDFQMPERFELEYIGQDGEPHRPVMIHRVVFGSIERFIAILTEHTVGAFPLWLSPVQVKIIPLSERHREEAQRIFVSIQNLGYRAEYDDRNEKIGYKIRDAQVKKIPYMIVIGDKEIETGQLAIRHRSDGDIGVFTLDAFSSRMRDEIESKKL